MQTLSEKKDLQTIAWHLYDNCDHFGPKKYRENEMYKELDRLDKDSVDRIIFNWIRQDYY